MCVCYHRQLPTSSGDMTRQLVSSRLIQSASPPKSELFILFIYYLYVEIATIGSNSVCVCVLGRGGGVYRASG